MSLMDSSQWKFQVQNLLDVEDTFLKKVDKSIQECFQGSFNPGPLTSYQITILERKVYRELVTLEHKSKIIFSCITSYSNPTTVRLSVVCIPRSFRARKTVNVFDYAIIRLKQHYKKLGVKFFELEAEKEPFEGLTQKIRVHIYGKRGFYINPFSEIITDDHMKEKKVKTRILMGDQRGTILSMPKHQVYRVRMDTGETKTVPMKDIDYCLAPDNTPIHCQMTMDLFKSKTRKHK